jgi:hypothetical protein
MSAKQYALVNGVMSANGQARIVEMMSAKH